jgi:ATP-dependent Lon protease
MPKGETLFAEVEKLTNRAQAASLPSELLEKVLDMITRLSRMAKLGGYSAEYEQLSRYIDWVISLPWNQKSQDVLDLKHAKAVLDKNHYGLEDIKERILEYLAVLAMKRTQNQIYPNGETQLPKQVLSGLEVSRAPILLFVGLVGTGKTTLAYSIAEAMGRKFARIPFGGMGDALQLRGQSRAYPDAEPGQVIKALKRAGFRNPVILLDELDRVAEGGRSDIMGVLIELLDPEQNAAFIDHYIDYPFNLSEVLFVATCNNTTNISPAVLDRLEPIQMPSYTDEQKIVIGKKYIFPKAMAGCSLDPKALVIDEEVWPKIVRPLGFDAGTRTLERTVNGICRKIAKMIVEGGQREFHITAENIKEFLPTW